MSSGRVMDLYVGYVGQEKTQKAIKDAFTEHTDWKIERTSCLGLCDRAPAILVNEEQAGPYSSASATEIARGRRGQPKEYYQPRKGETRVMMANAGIIDPKFIKFCTGDWGIPSIGECIGTQPRSSIERG